MSELFVTPSRVNEREWQKSRNVADSAMVAMRNDRLVMMIAP